MVISCGEALGGADKSPSLAHTVMDLTNAAVYKGVLLILKKSANRSGRSF